MSDPSIGNERVERIINAAHGLRFQTYRVVGEKHLNRREQEERLLTSWQSPLPQPLIRDS